MSKNNLFLKLPAKFKPTKRMKTYKINEPIEKFSMPDFTNIEVCDYWIGKLKDDPDLYKKAVFYLAPGLKLFSYITPCFADEILGIGNAFNQVLNLLFEVAQYSFLALGLKEAVVKIINGGTVKEAIQSSLQYAFGFMFLKLYPTIYNCFSKIKV